MRVIHFVTNAIALIQTIFLKSQTVYAHQSSNPIKTCPPGFQWMPANLVKNSPYPLNHFNSMSNNSGFTIAKPINPLTPFQIGVEYPASTMWDGQYKPESIHIRTIRRLGGEPETVCAKVVYSSKALSCPDGFKLNLDQWCIKTHLREVGFICEKGLPDLDLANYNPLEIDFTNHPSSLSMNEGPLNDDLLNDDMFENELALSEELFEVIGESVDDVQKKHNMDTKPPYMMIKLTEKSMPPPAYFQATDRNETDTIKLQPMRCFVDQPVPVQTFCPPNFVLGSGNVCILEKRVNCSYTDERQIGNFCYQRQTVPAAFKCPLDARREANNECYVRRYFPLEKRCAGTLIVRDGREFCLVEIKKKPVRICPLSGKSAATFHDQLDYPYGERIKENVPKTINPKALSEMDAIKVKYKYIKKDFRTKRLDRFVYKPSQSVGIPLAPPPKKDVISAKKKKFETKFGINTLEASEDEYMCYRTYITKPLFKCIDDDKKLDELTGKCVNKEKKEIKYVS